MQQRIALYTPFDTFFRSISSIKNVKIQSFKTFFFPSEISPQVRCNCNCTGRSRFWFGDRWSIRASESSKKGQVSPPVKNRLNTKRKNPNSMSDFLRGPGIFSKWLNDLNLVTTMAWVLKYSLGLFHGYYISLGSWKKRFQGKSRFFNNLIWFHKLGWIFSMNIPLYSRRCCPSHHCLLDGKNPSNTTQKL